MRPDFSAATVSSACSGTIMTCCGSTPTLSRCVSSRYCAAVPAITPTLRPSSCSLRVTPLALRAISFRLSLACAIVARIATSACAKACRTTGISEVVARSALSSSTRRRQRVPPMQSAIATSSCSSAKKPRCCATYSGSDTGARDAAMRSVSAARRRRRQPGQRGAAPARPRRAGRRRSAQSRCGGGAGHGSRLLSVSAGPAHAPGPAVTREHPVSGAAAIARKDEERAFKSASDAAGTLSSARNGPRAATRRGRRGTR